MDTVAVVKCSYAFGSKSNGHNTDSRSVCVSGRVHFPIASLVLGAQLRSRALQLGLDAYRDTGVGRHQCVPGNRRIEIADLELSI